MEIGDIVVRKSYGKDITFKIIDIKEKKGIDLFILKGINLRIIADSPIEDLEQATEKCMGSTEKVFDDKVNLCIKKILKERESIKNNYRNNNPPKNENVIRSNNKELVFGRPGRILHVDGDSEYLNNCMKVYKQLSLEAVGKVIPEREQPSQIVDLAKQYKPDIVVITGHDGILREVGDYMDLNNYRNSKYFIESVSKLRNYELDYDDLVIFAGACQSCYEAILDAGAN